MKIMSLNVNQFRPIPDRDLFAETKTREIIAITKAFLYSDPDNVVFLQEVQDWLVKGELENMLNGALPESSKPFNVISHKLDSPRRAHAYTVAIIRRQEDSNWELAGEFKNKNNGLFENRFLEIRQDKLNLHLLGVHAPLEDKYRKSEDVQKFFDALRDYAKNNTDKRLVILGDLNCHRGKKSTHKKDLEEIEKYLFDLVKDIDITYFSGKTTIDHVLISKELESKAVAQVIPREILELSDHAVIIVDIKE